MGVTLRPAGSGGPRVSMQCGGQSDSRGKLQPSRATPRLHSTEKQNPLAKEGRSSNYTIPQGTGVRIWTRPHVSALLFLCSSRGPEFCSQHLTGVPQLPTSYSRVRRSNTVFWPLQALHTCVPLPPHTLIKKDSELWPADTR